MSAIGEILEEMVRPRLERAGSDRETKRPSASLQRILRSCSDIMSAPVTAAMLENYWRYNDCEDREEGDYRHHFVPLTVGVREMFSETWTYGNRSHARTEQLRRCRQEALREISKALRSDSDSSMRRATDET